MALQTSYHQMQAPYPHFFIWHLICPLKRV